MKYLESILSEDYADIINRLMPDVWLDLQSVGTVKGIGQAQSLLLRQRDYFKKVIDQVKVFHRFEDAETLVVEYDILLKNAFDLPLVIVLAKQGALFSSLRSYHSVYPITQGREFRGRLFNNLIHLERPKAVASYFEAVAIGSVQKTLDTLSFERNVYFREPAGWRWNHKGKAGLTLTKP